MWQKVRLRLKYGSFDHEQMIELLHGVLGGNRRVSSAMYKAMFDALTQIRPDCKSNLSTDMRWKYWIAMTLRYLPCLKPAGKSNTVSHVHHMLKQSENLVQILLFSDTQAVRKMLQSSFQASNDDVPFLNSDQINIVEIILYHVQLVEISDRQIGNWSKELLKDWAFALHTNLHVPTLYSTSRVIERLVVHFSNSGGASDPSQFKDYMEMFRTSGLDWAYAQALGYHHEIRTFLRQVTNAAERVAISSIATGASISIIAILRLSENPVLPLRSIVVVFGLISLVILILSCVQIGASIFVLTNRLDANLQTLQEIQQQYL